MTQAETVSSVDLDEIFNTLDVETVKDFKEVITGFRDSYEGVTKQANEGAQVLQPASLHIAPRLRGAQPQSREPRIARSSNAASLSALLAERRDDLSELVAMHRVHWARSGASARRSLTRSTSCPISCARRTRPSSISARRSTMSTRSLRPRCLSPTGSGLSSGEFRAAAADAVPTIRDLDAIVRRPGDANDLVELTRLQVPLAKAGVGTGAPNCGEPHLQQTTTRPRPTRTSRRGLSARPTARLRTRTRSSRPCAPIRLSWSAGSTASRPRGSSTPPARSGASTPRSTRFHSRQRPPRPAGPDRPGDGRSRARALSASITTSAARARPSAIRATTRRRSRTAERSIATRSRCRWAHEEDRHHHRPPGLRRLRVRVLGLGRRGDRTPTSSRCSTHSGW